MLAIPHSVLIAFGLWSRSKECVHRPEENPASMPRRLFRATDVQCVLGLVLAVAGNSAHAELSCSGFEALGLEIAAARDSNPAEGAERGGKALIEAAALSPPCPTGSAMLLGGIASNLHILGRNPEAIRTYEEALATLGDGGTPGQIAFLHRGLGVALVDIEAYPRALEHYLKALGVSDAAGERIESAKTAGNIGILYTSIGEFELSRDYHQRSLAAFEAVDFKPGIAGALINLGSVAAKFGAAATARGDVEDARHEHLALQAFNERALALFAELGNQRGVAYAESNIGLALDRLGQPLQALPHHRRSLALRREIGDVFGTINSLLSIAATTRGLQRNDESAAALDEAATLVPEESLNLQKEIAEQRVLLAEVRGDYRQALAAQREVIRLGALIAAEDQRSEIAELQDRFDADKAAKQIDLLRSEANVADLKLQRQRLVTRLSVLIAALATALFLVLLSWHRVGVRSARELAVAARTDPLTGLPNRRHLLELMREEQNRADRGGLPFGLLMADLDDFKAINDLHGHDVGDAVLREVARRLRDAVREQDSVARWGGEEFLLLLPETSESGAMRLADKLRERIAHEPFTVTAGQAPIDVTLTLGFSAYRPGMALDDCIRAADAVMYRGKREGKNRTAADSTAVPFART